MPDIVVLGGGFAGLWSAVAAARLNRLAGGGLDIALVTPQEDLVLRPRLYEADPGGMRAPLDRVLRPVGVTRIRGEARALDHGARTVTITGPDGAERSLGYRRLVLATGSTLRRPDIPGARYLHDVDTLPAAVALDEHLRALPDAPPGPERFTAVVVGAGFTGLEVATELVGRLGAVAGAERPRVVLVDRSPVVGAALGPGPRPVIEDALARLGVETLLGRSLGRVGPDRAVLDDGTVVPARTVVWTAGVVASPLTAQLPGDRDATGRLLVDEELRVPGAPEVFAAGDTAAAPVEPGRRTLPSCQHAMPLGRFAGHNAAADLLGRPAVPFATKPYTTCLDLGAAGAVLTTGWERTVRLTGEPARARKRTIVEQWIYPPLDDATAIMEAADISRPVPQAV